MNQHQKKTGHWVGDTEFQIQVTQERDLWAWPLTALQLQLARLCVHGVLGQVHVACHSRRDSKKGKNGFRKSAPRTFTWAPAGIMWLGASCKEFVRFPVLFVCSTTPVRLRERGAQSGGVGRLATQRPASQPSPRATPCWLA